MYGIACHLGPELGGCDNEVGALHSDRYTEDFTVRVCF